MLTTYTEWLALDPMDQLARVNDVERDLNTLRGFLDQEPIAVTSLMLWDRTTPAIQYATLIEVEMQRDNLRYYAQTFYHAPIPPKTATVPHRHSRALCA